MKFCLFLTWSKCRLSPIILNILVTFYSIVFEIKKKTVFKIMIFKQSDKIHIFSVSILKGFVLLFMSDFFFKWNFVFWVCAHGCVENKGTHNMFFWMALHLNFWVRVYLVDLRLANQLSYCLLHIHSVLFRHEHAHTVPYSRPCVCAAALCPLSHHLSSWINLLGWKLDRNIPNCILSSVCIPNTHMLLQWKFV